MSTFRIKRFTQYDQTDQLKLMKDSDILALQKKSNMDSYANAAMAGGMGAVAGATLGAGYGGFRAIRGDKRTIFNPKRWFGHTYDRPGATKAIRGGIKGGALLGAGIGVTASLLSSKGQRRSNDFYNKRLGQALEMSRRREADDWKNNITNRTGYTY